MYFRNSLRGSISFLIPGLRAAAGGGSRWERLQLRTLPDGWSPSAAQAGRLTILSPAAAAAVAMVAMGVASHLAASEQRPAAARGALLSPGLVAAPTAPAAPQAVSRAAPPACNGTRLQATPLGNPLTYAPFPQAAGCILIVALGSLSENKKLNYIFRKPDELMYLDRHQFTPRNYYNGEVNIICPVHARCQVSQDQEFQSWILMAIVTLDNGVWCFFL